MSAPEASGVAYDAEVDMSTETFARLREARYRTRLADESDAAVVKIEAQISGLRQSLATRRAEAEEHRAAARELGV